MPYTRQVNAVRLEFDGSDAVHSNLSGAAFCGSWLFVAGDEAARIDRLQALPTTGAERLRYGKPQSFTLASLLSLPGAEDDEADIEGLALHDGWLWLVGSHAHKRKSPKPERSHANSAKRLAKVALDGNRRLLACVPIEDDAQGRPTPVAVAADGRRARRLHGDSVDTPLVELLTGDPHFGPYMPIPGKDNGFDIEGLAVDGQRLLLGLRGPVLRGWSAVLEMKVEPQGDGLRLAPLDKAGTLLRKHFVELGGLGLRDLHFSGDDLLLLAGPTMALDGAIRVHRWAGARPVFTANEEPVRFEPEACRRVATLPYGIGSNRAEALCQLPAALNAVNGGRPTWLVLYDAPGPGRLDGEHTVFGDLLRQG